MSGTKSVVVGMSGGVDSAAAALLLMREGYFVEGVTLHLWGDASGGVDARRVCDALGIRHTVLDERDLFRNRVVEVFADEYTAGRTPNPCVVCNREVKFAALAKAAKERGFAHIATGHYARVSRDSQSGRSLLLRAANIRKDQSYALYRLPQNILGTLLLPLGDYAKDEIRAIALEAGLEVSQKADSQDICFVPDGNYAGFLRDIRPGQNKAGSFVDDEGNFLGEHRGLWHYTVGQRKGLGITFGKPMFVKALDSATGAITLTEDAGLYQSALTARSLNWIGLEEPKSPIRLDAKIRYSAPAVPALVTPLTGDRVRVEFDAPQRAVTPGQHVVFYNGDSVAGGGQIMEP